MAPFVNAPAPGVPFFSPAQYPASGTAVDPQPDGNLKEIPTLFHPIKIRGLEFQNRIWLSPMCQYSAENGFVTPWHFAHLGGIVSRGPGLSFVEAAAVSPEGRITPEDIGIWSDDHVAGLRQIVDFAHSQNQKIAIQLGHAGRKASTVAPWLHPGHVAIKEAGGWPDEVVGPSDIIYYETFPKPNALTKEGIHGLVQAFGDGAKRALKAGFDVIEIHNAHGYLLHQFLSPFSNNRTDEYGGSFENRVRFTLEVVDAVRAVIPPSMPLFLRISATDWLEDIFPNAPSWRVEDTVKLVGLLADRGVDLIDVSSGGISTKQQRANAVGTFQALLSEAVKKSHGDKILVSAVKNITSGEIAQEILDKGQADVVFVGRSFQKNPAIVWKFAEDLGVAVTVAHQIEWGFAGRKGIGRNHLEVTKKGN
ncbi:NADPH dehydrogenase YqjM-like protein [Abortiporus biennis]